MTEHKTLLDLSGRVALVTGGGQGVGRGIAVLLARQNARVVVNDYFEDRAARTAQEIRESGGEATGIAADVTDLESVEAMVKRTGKEFGPVDILVNNAGNAGATGSLADMRYFWETDPGDWEKYLSVNLYGVMNSCHACVGSMVERGYGRIVTIISDAGRAGEAKLAAYSAAKAGAAGFMRALAKEVGRYGITANCVALSSINNPALAGQFKDVDAEILKRQVKEQLKAYSIRRFGEPEDVAPLVLLLSSEESAWITGQTYPINGGYSPAL